MAIVVERVAQKVDSSAATNTTAFTGTPTVGNRCIVVGWQFEGTSFPSAVGDNASGGSNTYAGTERDYINQSAWVIHAPLDRTLSNLTMTVQVGGGSGGVFCASAIEVSGLQASPVDVAIGADVFYGDFSPATWSLATGALAQADELIVRSAAFPATAIDTYNITELQWSGQTPTLIVENDGTGIASEYGTASYLIVNSTSSVTTKYQADSVEGEYSPHVIVTFKAQTETGTPEWKRDYAPDK